MNDLRTWASRRPEPSGSLGTWLGLFIGFLLVVQTGAPTPAVLTCMFALAATLLVSLRWRIGGVAVLVLLLVGAVLRHDVIGHPGSDVLAVTRAAIEQALRRWQPLRPRLPSVDAAGLAVRLWPAGSPLVPPSAQRPAPGGALRVVAGPARPRRPWSGARTRDLRNAARCW